MPVTLRGPDGQTIDADEQKINFWVNQGYRPIGEDELGQELAQRAEQPEDRGALGSVNALLTRTLSGMTLGGSDVLLSQAGTQGQRRRLAADVEQHPTAGIVGQVAGEVLPAIATGGESLAASELPAAKLGRFATEAGELVPGAGAASRVSRMAVTGAVEGSVSNAGQYLGQMALQDKPASAEGFLASMRDGALYGGGTAGALGIAGEGLVAARRLLPEIELTPIAARRAKDAAVHEVSRAVDDSGELIAAGRARARRIREETIAQNPEMATDLQKIALQKAKDLADAQTAGARARQMKLEADAGAARARQSKYEADAEAAKARAERAKNPGKRGKVTPEEAPATEPIAQDAAGAVSDVITPGAPAADDVNSELMRQLQGTKQKIDEGASISDLSQRRKETFVEDALNRRVAEVNPDMDRLLRHLDGLTDAREQVGQWLDKHPGASKVKQFEYAEGMRKQSGYAEVVPAGEGNILKPRGRTFELRGGEEGALGFENKVARGDLHRIVDDPLATAEEKAAATRALSLEGDAQAKALAEIQGTRGTPGVDRLDPKSAAKEIVGAGENVHAPSVDDHVERALNGHADLHDDVHDATSAIGDLEQKTADLSDELGDEAPVMAKERARQFRQVQSGVDESQAKATESAVSDADRAAKTIGLGAPQARRGIGLLEKAKQAGQLLEALQLLGVPVPSVKDIPVVGPLLSLYLKAKLAGRVLGRLGGKVPRTAETEIARRAAETKTRLIRAADHALASTARAATSRTAVLASAVLSATLFDDRDPNTPEKKTAKTDDLQEIYRARRDELQRAQAPDAVYEAVRKRIRTADVALLDEIAKTETAKLKFLHDKMPEVSDGVPGFGARKVQAPARADMEKWAKYVGAAQDPVGTLERLLSGELVSSEAAETIRTVYPTLLQSVQQRIIEKSIESPAEIPYKRKVCLSQVLGLPLDDSQSPEAAQFMGMMYAAKPSGGQPPGGGQPTGMPQSGPAPQLASRVDPETRGSVGAL